MSDASEPTDSHDSVSSWIKGAKAGDPTAAQRLWELFFERLVRLCGKKLGTHPRRASDEEDVALSAFHSFWEGARQNRFPQLQDQDDLWQLLVVIAGRKVIDLFQHDHRQRRGGGCLVDETALIGAASSSGFLGLDQVIGDEPTPEFAAIVTEEYERLLADLANESLRQVAQRKLEGFSNEEIAKQLDCSLRSVERKLRLIRETWSDGGANC